MVINPSLYVRDLGLAQEQGNPSDKAFLTRHYAEHLVEAKNQAYCQFAKLDENFATRLRDASVIQIESTAYASPNTVVTLKLPENDKGHLRGTFNLKYDRISLPEYFNIDEVLLNGSDKNGTIIDYDAWLAALKEGREALFKLIQHHLGYKFGRTFTRDGVYLGGTTETKPMVTGTKPLAMIIPSIGDIIEGWKFNKNIEQIRHGSVTYQLLKVNLRLVSSDHLFIEDGEIVMKIKLRRALDHYKCIQGGEHHEHQS